MPDEIGGEFAPEVLGGVDAPAYHPTSLPPCPYIPSGNAKLSSPVVIPKLRS